LENERLEKESLENWRLERERESGDFDGIVRVPCAKGRRRNATSQKQVGAPSCQGIGLQMVAVGLGQRGQRGGSVRVEHRVLRRGTVNSRGYFSRPSVVCSTEPDLARRTSHWICGFERCCPGELSDYLRSPGIATNQNPEARKPHYQPEKEICRPAEAFKRPCLGEAQRFSKSRNGYRSRPQGAETTIRRVPPPAR